jgi:hypothetical protein
MALTGPVERSGTIPDATSRALNCRGVRRDPAELAGLPHGESECLAARCRRFKQAHGDSTPARCFLLLKQPGLASQRDGIMLAPGAIFRPHLERSPWMRFNVTICEDTRMQRWLQRQTASKAA